MPQPIIIMICPLHNPESMILIVFPHHFLVLSRIVRHTDRRVLLTVDGQDTGGTDPPDKGGILAVPFFHVRGRDFVRPVAPCHQDHPAGLPQSLHLIGCHRTGGIEIVRHRVAAGHVDKTGNARNTVPLRLFLRGGDFQDGIDGLGVTEDAENVAQHGLPYKPNDAPQILQFPCVSPKQKFSRRACVSPEIKSERVAIEGFRNPVRQMRQKHLVPPTERTVAQHDDRFAGIDGKVAFFDVCGCG
mmetsp:Transcript_23036/g.32982  ORF Transcript_23036/g.32982 Transcript_23036/m.32982 type:complete len:244 (-) Transcript_23036:343-1074(-)